MNSNQSNSDQRIPSWKVVAMGELIVNLPVTVIILVCLLILSSLGWDWNHALIIGAVLGWIVWGRLLNIWKKWALSKGVDRDRLYYLGMVGLINMFKSKIFDEEKK